MLSKNDFDLYDQLEDLEDLPCIRNLLKQQTRNLPSNKKPRKCITSTELIDLAEQENALHFSYSASKHEKEWLINSLPDLYRQQWFDDILRLIKGGGKEASVYQCLGNDTTQTKYLAAKVYRPRQFRQLRNDSLYREGRQHLDNEGHEIRDDRALHAIQQRTKFGQRLLHTSWIEHEFQAMQCLHQAHADVPKPYASGNNAILMDYIGWDDLPAPTLNSVSLTPDEVQPIFDRVIHNVEIMLSNHLVHGDLSAYNILYMDGKIWLIDFPQAVDPEHNLNAYPIFQRDIKRTCEYFQSQGLSCNASQLAEDIWLKHGYHLSPMVHPKLLEPEVEND